MACWSKKIRTIVKVMVAATLLFNIAVAVYVIIFLANTPSQKRGSTDLKQAIEKVHLKYSLTQSVDKQLLVKGDSIGVKHPSLEFLSLLKPVAHFSGLDFAETTATLPGRRSWIVPLRNWANSEGSERTLLYNDMTYQNGSIPIPAAGVYHITSHVKFYVKDNRKDDNSSKTFQHQIVRYIASSKEQVVLFENVVTECREGINDGAHLEYPSLTGGLAHLDAGDQVIVRVSHFDLLKHDRDWHFFDMYLV